MKYSITAYDKAENELKRRREAVMNEHEVHAQEIAQRLPEIEVLTRSLKANNCELMKGIVGKNAHGREYIQKMRQNNANPPLLTDHSKAFATNGLYPATH